MKRIITNPNLVDVSGDNESCVVMMNNIDYYNKLQEMVNTPVYEMRFIK